MDVFLRQLSSWVNCDDFSMHPGHLFPTGLHYGNVPFFVESNYSTRQRNTCLGLLTAHISIWIVINCVLRTQFMTIHELRQIVDLTSCDAKRYPLCP